jgi:hypothetical protein
VPEHGSPNRWSIEMSHIKERVGWGVFEWVVTLLLTACAGLLTACAALLWIYLSSHGRDISNMAAYSQIEIGRVLLAVKEQQVLSNSKLDAVRDELHALNEKAAIATRVTPPEKNGVP